MIRIWPERWTSLLLAGILCSGVCSGSIASNQRAVQALKPALLAREQAIWRLPVRDSQFTDVPHSAAIGKCELTRPPEALTTPSPLLDTASSEMRIKVSFIIGTDGKVHSPLVLESEGQTEDRTVLKAVRSWRYRPGMCNGVPTETEGKVEFSSR